jgi:hypothetical protein
LCLFAHIGEFGLCVANLILQTDERLFTAFKIVVEAVQPEFLGVVTILQAGEGFGQRDHIQRAALVAQLFATAVGIQRLAIEIIDLGALNVAGAGGFALGATVCIPTLLPVGKCRFSVVQRLLAVGIGLFQRVQPRLGVGDLSTQCVKPGLVVVNMQTNFRERLLRLVAGALQTQRHFALMGNLLFDPGECTADFIAFGLCFVQRFSGSFAAFATEFDLTFGLALLGDDLLQPGLFLRQTFAQRLQLAVEQPELQRFPLRVLDPAFGLDRLVLLGLFGLPRQMLQLLADFLAQVVQAVEIFAGVANAGLGFLAALFVLGDAGGFFQIDAQLLGLGLDDLRDHALLDD